MEAVSKKICILKSFSDMLKSTNDDFMHNDKVYGIIVDDQKMFFETKKELKEFIKSNSLPSKDVFKVEYIGKYLDHDNVIKLTNDKEILIYEMIDDSTYLFYGPDKDNKYRWQFKYGSITEYYKALDRYEIKKLIR